MKKEEKTFFKIKPVQLKLYEDHATNYCSTCKQEWNEEEYKIWNHECKSLKGKATYTIVQDFIFRDVKYHIDCFNEKEDYS